MNRGILFFLLTFLGLTAVVYGITEIIERTSPLRILGPEGHKVEDFSFESQKGETFRSETADGKIWIANCFFSSCPIVCPKVMRNLQNVHDYLRNDENVITLSFTVDPKRDTPERLMEYGKVYNANPDSWVLLTGERTELYKELRKSFLLGAANSAEVTDDFLHSESIVIVDPDRQIRAMIGGTDKNAWQEVLKTVKTLKKEFKIK